MENMIMGFIFLPMLLAQCFMAPLAISQPNFPIDQFALLEFKAHITFDPLHILSSNWSPATSVCNWVGVSCSALHRRVTALDLPSMNLIGSLPAHLGNLSFLVSLNLSGNNFHGHLPPELGKLQHLRLMDLSNNFLNGSIPDEIWLLSKLEIFRVRSNHFTGTISRNIGNLTKLRRIYIGSTKIRGEIPQEMGNLHNLELFSASNGSFSGLIPANIFNISSLRWIYLYSNNLSGTLPIDLCYRLPNIELLELHKNQLEGLIPSSIGKCKKLQILSLSKNRFTGFIARSIGNLTKLSEIYLSQNNLEGEIPEEVGNLPLKILSMGYNSFIDSIPPKIFNISTLEYIFFGMNNLSGHLPSTIGLGLPKLTELHLFNNELSGIFPNSISNSSLLTFLNLNNNLFSGPFPSSLGHLRFLRTLHLGGNMFSEFSTPERSFLSSLVNCRLLANLSIAFNSLSVTLPASIGNLSKSLQYLYASNSKIYGNIPVEIGNLSNLILLDLSRNDLIGPIPVTIGRLQKLQGLYLYRNRLQGTIPNDLCHLQRLYALELERNQLNGSMPKCLANLTSLRYLNLCSNNLTSTIPLAFWSLKYILVVYLSSNSFNGSLPLDFGNLRVLIEVDLSRNHLSGNLPNTIGDLKDLTYLSLAENTLEGNIPQSFDGLISLEFLDLSNNILSGVIPNSLEELSYLHFFNVSFNKLEGKIPSGGSFKNFSAQSFIGNIALCGLPRFQVPPCKSHKKSVHVLRLVLPLVVATILILSLVIIIFKRQHKSKEKSIDEETFPSLAKWKRVSYQELQHATNRFNERNLLGTGSFGSVYKGTLKDGVSIAIKVFNLQVEHVLESFDIECELLRNIRHRNLIKIITSCCNENFKALVLEFMPNGTLEKWLYSDVCCLNILQRLNIMIDVASALEYLHHGHSVPIIHCDLKPSNVLLDEDMVAHVGDFGLAKLLGEGESKMQTLQIATLGYMAPEYGSMGMVSTKGDVYSFGILVMETFTRRKPTDKMFTGEMNLKVWVNESLLHLGTEVVDASLMEEGEHFIAKANCVSSILEVALSCCAEAPKVRRNMMDVATMLKKIKNQYLKDIGN
ncbi:hypothetical protein SLEP1_g46477 [Rubroshorea leprosula]|uniref:non-specific serine/threonine protein kinase n=1 Tax=Rubroshorea leprosula TaxID=152421 RepID=A0AAV5LPS9_9ROSI|nr:hypothetical protein SLEP1_g46477 [Rubroshorea leprosula]